MTDPEKEVWEEMKALRDKRTAEQRRLLPETMYVDFGLGDETVCLDGHFTVKELQIILQILSIKE